MLITKKFVKDVSEEILKCDSGARLGAKWFVGQTESSLRPLVVFLQGVMDTGQNVKWSELKAVLDKIPAEKRTKYARAISWIEGRVAEFQHDIAIPGRGGKLTVRFEGFAPVESQEILENLRKLCPLLHQLAVSDKYDSRRDWFASGSLAEVATALENFDKYLNERCTGLTFKRLHVGMRCDGDEVKRGLAGQVLPSVLLKGEDRPDYRKPLGYLKVNSGLRIFLGPLYFSVRTNYDEILKTVALYRYMTLAHELSHKVIKTVDKVYELPRCRAIKDSLDAVACADSWGYFLTTALTVTTQDILRKAMQQRRAGMGEEDD